MKAIKESIYKRKSVRKYKREELNPKLLGEIENFIETIKPLHEEILVDYKIVHDTKNILPVAAPHYILIYSEKKEGYLNNVGFMFQQLNLFLSSKGLGACWLGMAKPKDKEDAQKNFVIAMGFGNALENPHRELADFKRKPAQEVYSGTDERLEAARLAPSAVNNQGWFFDEWEGRINVYQKSLNPLQDMLYGKMSQIDIGIAICHMYIVSLSNQKEFEFMNNLKHRDIKGFQYVGTVI